MSRQQKDIAADIEVPDDVFAQLLSNVRVAAKECAHRERDKTAVEEQPPGSVRTTQNGTTQNAVSLADEISRGDVASARVTDSDSSGTDDDAHSPDGSWPLAKWQHQVSMPQEATATRVNRSSLGGAALASEKSLPSKLARAPLQDARKAEKASRQIQKDTAGKEWFDMKAQAVTDSVRRDWRLLRLRATYDPKRFYKSFDSGKIPKYFQMGTIVEGMGEFHSARMTKKERKQTLTEELLADINLMEQRKRRFETLQAERQELARQRKKIRALHKRSKHRPKH